MLTAGAISGAVSEIVAEAMSGGLASITEKALERAEELGVDPGTEEFMAIVQEQTAASMEWGKLGAAVAVALSGHDVNVGIDVATNAVENNFAPMVYMGVVAAVQGLAALNAVLTTADGIEAYEKDGLPGVLRLMREDAAIAMSTGGVGKPTVKIKNLLQRLKSIKLKGIQLNRGASSSTSMGIDLDGNVVPKGKGRAVDNKAVEALASENSRKYQFNSDIFDKKIKWTSPAGTQQTYKVYQRNDIDWNLVRTKGDVRFIGKTNREAAQAGLAPQLPNGKFATLHHIGQDVRGPLVEASTHLHSFESVKLSNGKRPFDILHSQHGFKEKHPSYPVNHSIFQKEAREYWKEIAKRLK